MPKTTDYYRILGVGEKASPDEIKKAYRKLARDYHPDRNPDKPHAEERFKEIQQAYDVLSDPRQRKEYDVMRKNPFGGMGNGFQTPGGNRYYRNPDGTFVRFDQPDSSGDFNDLFSGGTGGIGDFFSKIFGGQSPEPERTRTGQRSTRSRKADEQTALRLSFDQALAGGKTEVDLPGGETVRITIPKGVRSGFKIRLKGYGQAGPGGQRGDLIVTFDVDTDPRFRREGDDLYTTVTVNALEAMLGTSRDIVNAYGKRIKLAIPAGTQPGEKFRLKGQGVATDKQSGDLYVEIQVTIPQNLSAEEREKIRKAAHSAGLI